jgi:hypothetical protein
VELRLQLLNLLYFVDFVAEGPTEETGVHFFFALLQLEVPGLLINPHLLEVILLN